MNSPLAAELKFKEDTFHCYEIFKAVHKMSVTYIFKVEFLEVFDLQVWLKG